jgi:TonB family protein
MKRILRLCVLVLAVVSASSACAQTHTDYLDATGENILPNADKAKYVRNVTINPDSSLSVVILYISGETKMLGTYVDLDLLVEHGDFKYFYANGKTESEGRFKQGLKVGVWKRWNFDGIAKPDRYYPDEDFKPTNRSTNGAKFPGGMDALQKLVQDSLNYPLEARERGIAGTVYVTFTIDATGEVHLPEVSSGVHYLLDDEAVRFVSSLPTWTPAAKNGTPVESSYIMPFTFDLGRYTSSSTPSGSK